MQHNFPMPGKDVYTEDFTLLYGKREGHSDNARQARDSHMEVVKEAAGWVVRMNFEAYVDGLECQYRKRQ